MDKLCPFGTSEYEVRCGDHCKLWRGTSGEGQCEFNIIAAGLIKAAYDVSRVANALEARGEEAS